MDAPTQEPPLLAIVGRPNVGKSSLFNRLVGRRQALVEDLPGTTRDRVYAETDWHGRAYRVVDTGGLEARDEGPFSPLVRQQIELALSEAAVLLLLVDGRDGLTAADFEIAELLRRSPVPVILVANKVDSDRRLQDAPQFYELGLGDPFPISAYHDIGVGDLMERVFELVPERPPEERERGPRVAVIGRPNAGKSALVNALLGDERVIVSDIPGTTRDVIDTPMEFEGRPLTLLDTAGIRRSGRIERGVERHSVQRAQQAVARADVTLCVMDASDPALAQDTHIAGLAQEAQTGIILVLNKEDLVEDEPATRKAIERYVQSRFRFVSWAPVLWVSALERTGLTVLLRRVLAVAEARDQRVPTADVNRVIRQAVADHGPRSVHGKRLKILYATQAGTRPPTFVIFVNDVELLHFSYQRFLENRLRAAFGFEGTAVRMVYKPRSAELPPGADDSGDREEPPGRVLVTPARRRTRARREQR